MGHKMVLTGFVTGNWYLASPLNRRPNGQLAAITLELFCDMV